MSVNSHLLLAMDLFAKALMGIVLLLLGWIVLLLGWIVLRDGFNNGTDEMSCLIICLGPF